MHPPKDPNGRPHSGPPFWKSAFRFVAGLGYLALVAVVLSGLTAAPFLRVFLAVALVAAFLTTLVLIWLTRWAMREDGRRGQFGLASLLFLTTLVAVCLAVVRWVVVSANPLRRDGQWSSELTIFLFTGALFLLLATLALPFLAGMAESLVWLAVWFVRRPLVRGWLSRRRIRDRNKANEPSRGPPS